MPVCPSIKKYNLNSTSSLVCYQRHRHQKRKQSKQKSKQTTTKSHRRRHHHKVGSACLNVCHQHNERCKICSFRRHRSSSYQIEIVTFVTKRESNLAAANKHTHTHTHHTLRAKRSNNGLSLEQRVLFLLFFQNPEMTSIFLTNK